MAFTQTWTWFEGRLARGQSADHGPAHPRSWLGSSVFDGARAFEGVTPDLELHLARVNNRPAVSA